MKEEDPSSSSSSLPYEVGVQKEVKGARSGQG
jgi:hypothetical protein